MLSPLSLLGADQHCGIPGPLSRLCVSQHGTFCLTPGGNTPITGRAPCHHPHSSHTRHYAGPVSAGLTPSCLHTVNIIINTACCQEHQRLCVTNIRTSCAWDSGTGCHLEETKTMAAWCRECEPQPNDRFSSELTLVAIRAIERRGRDTE